MKTIQRFSNTKSYFFQNINNIDKPLPKLTKQNSIQIRNKKVDVATESEEIFRKHHI